jgi:hypothetical protein
MFIAWYFGKVVIIKNLQFKDLKVYTERCIINLYLFVFDGTRQATKHSLMETSKLRPNSELTTITM